MCAAASLAIASLLLLITVAATRARGADEPEGEFKALFDGKSLSGWDGDARFWSVQDGMITGRTTAEQPAPHNTFLIYSGGGLRDFELHISFKLGNHNSGVQYRSKDLGDHVVAGYQADIVDDKENRYTGILYEERGRGVLAERGQKVMIDEKGKKQVESLGDAKELGNAIKKGDWNEYVIIARGNHLVQKINGQTMVELTDAEPGKAAREGLLALQIHQGPPMTVQFKDIKLRELKDEQKPETGK